MLIYCKAPQRAYQREQKAEPNRIQRLSNQSFKRDFRQEAIREYGSPGKHYFVTCHPGLEAVVERELHDLGIKQVKLQKAGVSFNAPLSSAYKANLFLRSGIRVLQYLSQAELDPRQPGGDEVYRAFRELPNVNWPEIIAPDQSFHIDARLGSCTKLTNSNLLAVRAKDAICDAIRDKRGAKPYPPPPGRTADVPLYVAAFQDRITVYRDMSGESLHRRGYRQAMHIASLNESAAAGILYLAGLKDKLDKNLRAGGKEQLVIADPMCGSGTFLIEAALMATNTAPGLYRNWWPFLGWKDGSQDFGEWRDAVEEARDLRRIMRDDDGDGGVLLYGNDVHAGALTLAQRDIMTAEVSHMIKLHHGNCAEWKLPHKPCLVVANPPWGGRLDYVRRPGGSVSQPFGVEDDMYDVDSIGGGRGGGVEGEERLAMAWTDLRAFLKNECTETDAFILSGNADITSQLRMKSKRKYPLTIGGVDCRLLHYEILPALTEEKKKELGLLNNNDKGSGLGRKKTDVWKL
jgi:putative N6-adenine-specific DNA methylase